MDTEKIITYARLTEKSAKDIESEDLKASSDDIECAAIEGRLSVHREYLRRFINILHAEIN